jgi:hypothetical protein
VAADLTPLEQAAARVGLPGLKARVVPHDRRRGWWFRWGRGELLVSDRVLDHCTPDDASALLINEVQLRAARLRPAVEAAIALASAVALALMPRLILGRNEPWVMVMAGALASGAWVTLSLGRARAAEKADDATVALLGDATPLVRGLNEMNFEEIHLAGRRLPARPDLHRRAERLVRLHRLCEAQPPA